MGKKGSGPKKTKETLVMEEAILRMKPNDLAVEVTFERNAIEALKKQKKDNDTLNTAKKLVKKFDEALNQVEAVAKAKEALDEAKLENMEPDHVEAKANVSALSQGFNNDIKDRKKKLNYMEKTLQRHIESGALKRINP